MREAADNRPVPQVLVATDSGLQRFDADTAQRRMQLEGHDVGAVAPASWKTLWAIVDGKQIWRSDASAGDWKQIASLTSVRGECLADTRANDENGILIGTSHAHLVRITHDQVAPVESFDHAPEREGWFTPWGGPPAVRSITENRTSVFVNVHVGGVLRSRDEGATWQPTIDIHADVHRVVTGGGRVYAAGAGGLSLSEDDGDTWKLSAKGLHARYCRSVAVCGETVLLSASDGPGGGRAALYRTDLDAKSFERCRTGLPEWFEGNIDSLSLDALPDGSFCAFGTESGGVFVSKDHGSTWSQIAEGAPAKSVLVLP
ncbi:MAG TPA: hypothetical protein VNA65_03290 [Candidatus Dormibacteraeota bacterium]|nr:hypothetical protein [Candidatus Dormibacteraeota bacterium]